MQCFAILLSATEAALSACPASGLLRALPAVLSGARALSACL